MVRLRLVSTDGDGRRRRRTDDMRRGEGDYEIKKDPFLPSLLSGLRATIIRHSRR